MPKHLQVEIEKLKKRLLLLSAHVEDSLRMAVESIDERDANLAQQVIDGDSTIDRSEIEVEEECLKILALHQPVAVDLRFIVGVIKMNNDLERIGDLAVNIAERSAFLAREEPVNVPFDFAGMAEKTQWMLRRVLDALMKSDTAIAREVCLADDQVDAINREMYDRVKEGIRRHPEHLNSFIHLLCISRHVERIADLATNIAQDVIYMVEGDIVRHWAEDYTRQRGRG